MSVTRIVIVVGGTLLMLLQMLLRRKKFPDIPVWVYPVACILLAISGVVGAFCMHYVENGDFNGTSFFGGMFLSIIVMPLVALVLRVRPMELMDVCAPAGCLMLAVLKLDCLRAGCCYGLPIGYINGELVRYPSQIMEMLAVLLVMVVLLRRIPAGRLAPWYMILYGVVRFVLNFARDDLQPFVWILPPGNFWSLISIAIGSIWLVILKAQSAKTESQPQPS